MSEKKPPRKNATPPYEIEEIKKSLDFLSNPNTYGTKHVKGQKDSGELSGRSRAILPDE